MMPILQIEGRNKDDDNVSKPCYFDIYVCMYVCMYAYWSLHVCFSSLRDLESREQNVTSLVACNKAHVLLVIPSNASTTDCTYRLVRPAGLISLICAIMKA
jgi:hypothetical protein